MARGGRFQLGGRAGGKEYGQEVQSISREKKEGGREGEQELDLEVTVTSRLLKKLLSNIAVQHYTDFRWTHYTWHLLILCYDYHQNSGFCPPPYNDL